MLKEAGVNCVEVIGDLLLVFGQLVGEFECKDDILRLFYAECQDLL